MRPVFFSVDAFHEPEGGEDVAVKLDYENPTCPACGTRLTPLTELVKTRCHVCGWEIFPMNGYDVYAVHREYVR